MDAECGVEESTGSRLGETIPSHPGALAATDKSAKDKEFECSLQQLSSGSSITIHCVEIQAPMTLDQRHTVCRVSLWRFSADG